MQFNINTLHLHITIPDINTIMNVSSHLYFFHHITFFHFHLWRNSDFNKWETMSEIKATIAPTLRHNCQVGKSPLQKQSKDGAALKI